MNHFIIEQRLPSLNDYITACRTNKYAGARFKDDIDADIGWYIRRAVMRGDLKPCTGQIVFSFEWHEKTARRDPDNIASAKKYILDALQKQRIIPNDTPKYVKGFEDRFFFDKKDFVVVELKSASE